MDIGERQTAAIKRKGEYRRKRDLDPDEEITLTYANHPQHKQGINAQGSVFKSVMDTGINRSLSIFDQTAVFRTGNGDNNGRSTGF